MPRPAKQVRTIHHLGPTKQIRTLHHATIAESLKRQSQQVLFLISAVQTALSVMGDAMPMSIRDELRAQCNATEAAMWPGETES